MHLSTQISFGGSDKIEYIYDASGIKLQKKVTKNSNVTTTDYSGSYVYQEGDLQFIFTPEGYATPNGSTFDYVYQYKDHLGNIRLSYMDSDGNGSVSQSEIIDENNFYPFGLKMEGFNSDITPNGNSLGQKWMFNSRELTESLELNNYEMDFRHYDAALGRFNSIDLFSELSYNFTPYRFGFNNPIVFNDPTGLFENRRQARRYRKQMKKKYKKENKKFRGTLYKNEDGSWSVHGSDGREYTKGPDSFFKRTDLNPNDGVVQAVLLKANSSEKKSNFGLSGGIAIYGLDPTGILQGRPGYSESSMSWDDLSF